MWKLRNVESTPDERPELTGCANKPTTDQLDHINQLVLSQIKTFLAKDTQSPFEYDEVNLDDLITELGDVAAKGTTHNVLKDASVSTA